MSALIIHLPITPDHFYHGDVTKVSDCPIALALKERLELDVLKNNDIVAVGTDEIYLRYKNKSWTCDFDVKGFYKPRLTEKPRLITLRFKEVPLSASRGESASK